MNILFHKFYCSFYDSLIFKFIHLKEPTETQNLNTCLKKILPCEIEKTQFLTFIHKISEKSSKIFSENLNKINLNKLNDKFYTDIYTDLELECLLNQQVNIIQNAIIKKFSYKLNSLNLPNDACRVILKCNFESTVKKLHSKTLQFFKDNLAVFNSSSSDDEVSFDNE